MELSRLASRVVVLPLVALATLTTSAPALADSGGPDVSSWQHPGGASINWVLVKASGHSFGFVKATEDTTYTNPYFASDWAGMQAAGINRGAYHFARPATSASAQASYFISVVGQAQSPGDLPPTLDLEDSGGLSPAALVSWTQTFVSTVQSLTGRIPIIYASPYFWRNAMGNTTAFNGNPLWLAQWAPFPSFPLPGGWPSWTFWQYSDAGNVPGIPATVDLSTFCCDYGSLRALAFGSTFGPAPAAPPANGTSLYAAALNGTGSGHVEVHALSQASNYTQFFVHTATAFGAATTADWQFLVASYGGDGQPDLFAIHDRNTASGRVEVHVVSAASGYQSFMLHAATGLAAVPAGDFQFALGSFGGDHRSNLYAISLHNTGSGRVEVHALSESSNYSAWLIHAATPLAPVANSSDWQFKIGDRQGSGDLVAIPHVSTGSGHTEVHVLRRDTGYSAFSVHTATPLGYTVDTQTVYTLGDHDNDGIPDLYAIAINGTGTGQTEVHVLSGSSNYNDWIEHTPTGLGPLSATSWQLSAH